MALFVKESYFYRRFFTLAVVIAGQNLIIFGVNLADNIMLGSYTETALSGANLAIQIQFLLQMLVAAIAEGTVILAARRWGMGDINAIKHITNIGLRFGLVLGALLMLLMLLFPREVLSLFTNETAIVAEAQRYVGLMCFSYIFFALTNIFLAAMRSVETVRIGFIISCSTLVVNVCLNYLLIYGNFGAPELGIRGAAIATLTARIIEFIIIVIYIKRFDYKIRFKFSDFFMKFHGTFFGTFARIVLPLLLSNAMWGIGMAIQTMILGHIGGAAIAANSITTTMYQIISVALYAAGSATVVLLGKTLGEGDVDRFKAYARTLQIIFLAIGVGSCLTLWQLKDIIINYYSISPAARALSLQFMTVLCVTLIGSSYQFPCLGGIVRSAGDTRFMLINDFIFLWLIVLPASYAAAFIFNLEPVYVFMCLKADQILKCIPAFIRVNRFKFINKMT